MSFAIVGVAYLAHTPEAEACGCFARPDPAVPIVQAGERIAFAMEDGVVTAHIQIQYEGEPEEFGWLLPLPSVPDMKLGTDELFAQLIATTQPRYRLNREFLGNCSFDPNNNNPGGLSGAESADDAGGVPVPAPPPPSSPLVLRDTIGPYDFAVLRADSKQPMLDWLEQERFFVPAGADEAIDPYIRPGAFFLALKLLNNKSAGDLQPVVVKYESELPMIPIILTGVAANPNMGVQVWVLGDSRAIPRNYFHTQINDAAIDWLNFGANYVSVVTDAVDEAEGHHSFVTEYAGSSDIMVDVLDWPGRFGTLAVMRGTSDAQAFIEYMLANGYAVLDNTTFQLQFSSPTLAILGEYLPVPTGLAELGVTPNEYYTNISYYLGFFRDENPELYTDLDLEFDPVALTDELEQRIITPTVEAGEMFRDNSYMSRLFTTLSPDEMTKDPVFSFNPDLPDVSRIHTGTLYYLCGFGNDKPQGETPARLVTEQGWELYMPDGEDAYDWPEVDMPKSSATEVLREEGAPEVVGDNAGNIQDAIDQHSGRTGGCNVAPGAGGQGFAWIALGLFAAVFVRRRR